MKRWMMCWVVGLVLCGATIEASAVSLLVDVDPGTIGVQSMRTVMVGVTFSVDVLIEQVIELNADSFDLSFNPGVVTATSVISGGFLPGSSLVFLQNIAAPDVNFAETALVPTGTTGSGVLASITFNSGAAGMTDLTLTKVGLSAPFGVPIGPVTLQPGTITVVDGQQPIPEPGTIVLFATGLGGLFLGRQFMRR